MGNGCKVVSCKKIASSRLRHASPANHDSRLMRHSHQHGKMFTMSRLWFQSFLIALRTSGGTIAPAARATGIAPGTVYNLIKTDADFAAAVEEVQEECYDDMERELARRAVEGVEEPVVYQGQLAFRMEIGHDDEGKEVWRKKRDADGQPIPLTVNKRSDALLMFALKGYRKRKFAERTELTGANGEPVQVDETTRAARIAQLLAVAKSRAEAPAVPDISDYA